MPQGRFSWRSLEEVYDRASSYSAALLERRLRPGDVCILALPTHGVVRHASDRHPPARCRAPARGASRPPGPRILPDRTPSVPHTKDRRAPGHRPGDGDEIRDDPARIPPVRSGDPGNGSGSPGRNQDPEDRAGRDIRGRAPADLGHDRTPLASASGRTRAITAALDGMARAMRLGESDVCLNWTPLYHDMGLANNFLLCLTRGIPLALLSPTDFVRKPALWLRGLSDTGSTVTWSPELRLRARRPEGRPR